MKPRIREITKAEHKIMDEACGINRTAVGDVIPKTFCHICSKQITKVHDVKEGPWDCEHCNTRFYIDDERLVNCCDIPKEPSPDYRYKFELAGLSVWRSPIHTPKMKMLGHHWFHDDTYTWSLRNLKGHRIKEHITMQDDEWHQPVIGQGTQVSIAQWFAHVLGISSGPGPGMTVLGGRTPTPSPVAVSAPRPVDIGLAFWLAPDYGTEDQQNARNPAYAPFWIREPAVQAVEPPKTRHRPRKIRNQKGDVIEQFTLGRLPDPEPEPEAPAERLPSDFDAFLASPFATYAAWKESVTASAPLMVPVNRQNVFKCKTDQPEPKIDPDSYCRNDMCYNHAIKDESYCPSCAEGGYHPWWIYMQNRGENLDRAGVTAKYGTEHNRKHPNREANGWNPVIGKYERLTGERKPPPASED